MAQSKSLNIQQLFRSWSFLFAPFFQFNIVWCCKVFGSKIYESDAEFTTSINFLVSEFWFVLFPGRTSFSLKIALRGNTHYRMQQAKQNHAVLVWECIASAVFGPTNEVSPTLGCLQLCWAQHIIQRNWKPKGSTRFLEWEGKLIYFFFFFDS